VTKATLSSWSITYDNSVLRTLTAYRERCLPHETGGVLLGIIDVSRRSIHVAHALPEPEDSHGSVTGFERGIVDLPDAIRRIAESSLYQLRYVGEWHSHPKGSSVWPSQVDLAQLSWLAGELEAEAVPALMAIAGDDGAFSFIVRDNASANESEVPRKRSGTA
jgi:proteasome lid subunit RPN8/RPN11